MEILGSHSETPKVSQGNGEWFVMYLHETVQPVNFKRFYGDIRVSLANTKGQSSKW